jgi:hypothetical protein
MADQKPKLDYARPGPSHRNLKADLAIGAVLSIAGLVGLLASVSWTWSFFHHDKRGFYCLIEAAVCAAFGLLAFWIILRRR